MQDKIIILTVVVVAMIGHAWLFLWVRFKVDEATVLKFLKESSEDESHNSVTIAENINISASRITKACRKSPSIHKNTQDDTWVVTVNNK